MMRQLNKLFYKYPNKIDLYVNVRGFIEVGFYGTTQIEYYFTGVDFLNKNTKT